METVLKVSGMSCQGCVKSVTRVLSEVADVSAVDVSLENAEARIQHAEGASVEAMRQAIEDAGFEVGG